MNDLLKIHFNLVTVVSYLFSYRKSLIAAALTENVIITFA